MYKKFRLTNTPGTIDLDIWDVNGCLIRHLYGNRFTKPAYCIGSDWVDNYQIAESDDINELITIATLECLR